MNMNSLPKISVAIVAYNAEKYIREAITSIVNQDYPGDIEIIILYDEGTTDKTLQVINELKESLPSRRSLVIFQHSHTSPFRARIYSLKTLIIRRIRPALVYVLLPPLMPLLSLLSRFFGFRLIIKMYWDGRLR